MRRLAKTAAGLAAFLALCGQAATAHADVSGWMHVGGGGIGWQDEDDELGLSPTLAIDAGVGSPDSNPFIVGGLFRLQPVIEHGTDIGLAARFATQGFQSGWLGVAVDAGPYFRTWETESVGLWGQASLGGPLGLQLSVLGSFGTESAAGVGVTLGVDLVRLTVHRKNLLDWWPNPRAEEALQEHAAARP